jgi:hypothetical protein
LTYIYILPHFLNQNKTCLRSYFVAPPIGPAGRQARLACQPWVGTMDWVNIKNNLIEFGVV